MNSLLKKNVLLIFKMEKMETKVKTSKDVCLFFLSGVEYSEHSPVL